MEDSSNERFTISCKETLLENQPFPQPNHTRKNVLKKRIFFFLLVLILVISCSIIVSYICRKEKPKPYSAYLSRSSKYYCHITTYRRLCYSSMPSVINTTLLKSTPAPIFSASLRVAINQLSTTNTAITKALSSTGNSSSIAEARLRECEVWVRDSLSRLNGSLTLLGVDSDIDSMTYQELDDVKAMTVAARYSALNCFWALQEIEGSVGEEEKLGVEEVKSGVDKARKLMINSLGLFDGRESIFFDFYDQFIDIDDYSYSYTAYYSFDYRFIVCLYSVLYLFLALLYFLFWRGD